MNLRRTHTQEAAAAKAAISVRSARRLEADPVLPSQKPRRRWRSRPDPLAEVWEGEVVPLLAGDALEVHDHRAVPDLLHGRATEVVPQLGMADEHDGEPRAGVPDGTVKLMLARIEKR